VTHSVIEKHVCFLGDDDIFIKRRQALLASYEELLPLYGKQTLALLLLCKLVGRLAHNLLHCNKREHANSCSFLTKAGCKLMYNSMIAKGIGLKRYEKLINLRI